jgi:hypothetical protein
MPTRRLVADIVCSALGFLSGNPDDLDGDLPAPVRGPQSCVSRGGARPITVNRPLELRIRGLERMTGIEPTLLAWEPDRSWPITSVIRQLGRPGVAVIDRSSPWLIARAPERETL